MGPTTDASAGKPAESAARNSTDQAAKPKTKTIVRKRTIPGRGQPAQAAIKPLGVVFVAHKAPFMSVVQRAVKVLDKGPGGARWSSTKVAPLEERVAQQGVVSDAKTARARSVLLFATGHAIGKLALVAAYFGRQPGYVTELRTRTLSTVDDIFHVEGQTGADAGEGMDVDMPTVREPRRSTRQRNLNCLEVAVRLR